MKKVAVITSLAAGLGLLAAPAMAQTGHVGVSYANVDVDGFGDADVWSGDATVAFNLGGGLNMKLDAVYSDVEGGGDTLSGTAHLFTMNENQAFGAFVSLVDLDYDDGYIIGGEYARFFESSTLALGAGFGNFDDSDIDVRGINGAYRIFANDNLRFDLGASWINFDGTGGDADALTLGVGVEYRFASAPVSVGASYQYIDFDDYGIDANVIGLTLRYDFGSGSLKERDRNGSGTFNPLGGFSGSALLF